MGVIRYRALMLVRPSTLSKRGRPATRPSPGNRRVGVVAEHIPAPGQLMKSLIECRPAPDKPYYHRSLSLSLPLRSHPVEPQISALEFTYQTEKHIGGGIETYRYLVNSSVGSSVERGGDSEAPCGWRCRSHTVDNSIGAKVLISVGFYDGYGRFYEAAPIIKCPG